MHEVRCGVRHANNKITEGSAQLSQRYCIVENCDEILGKRCKSDMCRTCRNGLRYWDDKPYSSVLARIQQVGRIRARLGHIAKPKTRRASVSAGKAPRAEARV